MTTRDKIPAKRPVDRAAERKRHTAEVRVRRHLEPFGLALTRSLIKFRYPVGEGFKRGRGREHAVITEPATYSVIVKGPARDLVFGPTEDLADITAWLDQYADRQP